MRLICVPFAGALKRNFDDFASFFGEGWEVTVLEYPGHGTRRKEDYAEDFDKLTFDMAEQVRSVACENDYVLMGYSMGSIVAYEMATLMTGPSGRRSNFWVRWTAWMNLCSTTVCTGVCILIP